MVNRVPPPASGPEPINAAAALPAVPGRRPEGSQAAAGAAGGPSGGVEPAGAIDPSVGLKEGPEANRVAGLEPGPGERLEQDLTQAADHGGRPRRDEGRAEEPLQGLGAEDDQGPAAEQEREALRLGVWVSLVIAAAGVITYAFSASDALLLDGLYAGVMALTSLVAMRIGAVVERPPERGWPIGFGGQEALFVLFRSLVLIGMLSVAVAAALREIGACLGGGERPAAVELAPVGAYTGLTVLLCLLLAWRQRRAWRACGRCSDLLLLESRAAALDAAITGGAGLGLLAAPLLAGTPLAALVPLSDPLLVILIALVVVIEPAQHFLEALRQTAGAACDPGRIADCRGRLQGLLADAGGDTPVRLLDVSLQKLGRTTFLMAWLDPARPVDGAWMDDLRQRIEAACSDDLGPLRCELLLTRQAPFHAPPPGGGP